MISMKNKFIRIGVILLFIAGVIHAAGGLDIFGQGSTVRAFGDLKVNFGVGSNEPIFTVDNMAPGDIESREVDVTNGGQSPQSIAVKGVRSGGVGNNPRIESALEITISKGGTVLYGQGSSTGKRTVTQFFNDSGQSDGIVLSSVQPGNSELYTFTVILPTEAGNEFQGKSVVFDLIFGTSKKQQQGGIHIEISGNGPGSVNSVSVQKNNITSIVQSNVSQITNWVNTTINTGKNKVSNTSSSTTNVTTGNAQSITNILNIFNFNFWWK